MQGGNFFRGKRVLELLMVAAILFALSYSAPASQGDIEGRKVYEKWCAACHGKEGKGDGPAQTFLYQRFNLYPTPRDFTAGKFKIRSTPSGQLPTDDDLFRVITNGITGASMPPWKRLSEKERRALVEYIKAFDERFKTQPRQPISIGPPPPRTPELLAKGKQLYEDMECGKCHGPSGKGDGPSAKELTDDWGHAIVPYDFTRPGRYKGGSTARDIYRTFTTGLSGTPMPSYEESLNEQERWALAYYVLSLSEGPIGPAPKEELVYFGAEVCKVCHPDESAEFLATHMGKLFLEHPRNARERLGCESCHGPGSAHVKDGGGRGIQAKLISFAKGDPTPIEQRNAVCLQCHERGERLFWKGSMHESRNVACTSCHKVMERLSDKGLLVKANETDVCAQCHAVRRAQLLRSSHMPLREGKLKCSDCHNSHGSATPKLIREDSVNELCYRCHAELRGPFLWEHPPVRENCLDCHEPHGTINEKLLKVKLPRACQRCHIVTNHITAPQIPTNRFVFNRSCTNCHSRIHGSNHPSGTEFLR